ncbi:ferredoxin family 2Fe-2S iron-sulfur cluster binding protein [Aspergillus homomorphus CBS 101889]|uniref:2Fe-2S iron-sulfur cluster binding domain protein n=1 Tax=Aspergillus homomorphus (strain CBS 101889) TaxID=1450537 RepID=A0A395HH80_ASPHC|nr:2Fe-2S iron-sulfur cluster binding domain protein [Aspergillus homomorphus CBS 101889]RAL06996.1 2Fe-2S iron-sulfur cluster binding domain protein [Aspergillus homomorphus CBS 101889]
MSFWREAGLNLRHVLPRTGESVVGRAPSSRFLASRFPLQSSRSMSSGHASLPSRRSLAAPRIQLSERRSFSVTAGVQHGHITPPKPGEEINISFIDKDGAKYDFQVSEGDNLLDIAQANDLEMEGACGGSCACSTCHVIVEDAHMFDKMEEPSDDENDMLDLAFGLTETSRLGCQVVMTKELDGLVVRLPSMTRNLQASDFEPKH